MKQTETTPNLTSMPPPGVRHPHSQPNPTRPNSTQLDPTRSNSIQLRWRRSWRVFSNVVTGAVQVRLRHAGGEHPVRILLVPRLGAVHAPQAKVHQRLGHQTQRVPERVHRQCHYLRIPTWFHLNWKPRRSGYDSMNWQSIRHDGWLPPFPAAIIATSVQSHHSWPWSIKIICIWHPRH